jgi:hypothetical protein
MYNVIFRRVRVSVVALENQLVLNIPCVCVSVFLTLLSGKQSTCIVLYCHLRSVWLLRIVTHVLINGTIFWAGDRGENMEYKKCDLIFYNF